MTEGTLIAFIGMIGAIAAALMGALITLAVYLLSSGNAALGVITLAATLVVAIVAISWVWRLVVRPRPPLPPPTSRQAVPPPITSVSDGVGPQEEMTPRVVARCQSTEIGSVWGATPGSESNRINWVLDRYFLHQMVSGKEILAKRQSEEVVDQLGPMKRTTGAFYDHLKSLWEKKRLVIQHSDNKEWSRQGPFLVVGVV